MSRLNAIESAGAPRAIGPYSQAVTADGWVFTAGQLGLDPESGALLDGVQAQTRRALDNLVAVLGAAGCSLADVVKATIFLADLEDFGVVNGVWSEYFGECPPARSTVGVAALPRGGRVEIELVARQPGTAALS